MLFIVVLFTMVYISVTTEFSLVAENYYEQEINYEDQLNSIRNYNALTQQPEFQFDRSKGEISLTFDPSLAEAIKEGKVVFFRASNARYDQEVPLTLDDQHRFKVSSSSLLKGAWTIKLSWMDDSLSYYKEIKFVI